MTINISFTYDKSSVNWYDDYATRIAFCKTGVKYLKAKYEAQKYLYFVDICNYFGVYCPVDYIGFVIYYNQLIGIDFEVFTGDDDFVNIFCKYSCDL